MNKLAAGFMVIAGLAAGRLGAASVNLAESWSSSNTVGWTATDVINEVPVTRASSFSAAGGALKIGFASQLDFLTKVQKVAPVPPLEYLIKAGPGASGGLFTGDYLSNGVAAASFRLQADSPVQVWLAFSGAVSNRWWQYSLGPQPTGSWRTVTVPLHPDYFKELRGATDWHSLEQDLKNVAWIGILVRQCSALTSQTVQLDDFSLVGPGPEFASWMAQFSGGMTLSDGRNPLPGADLDADGVINFDEWVAGTSAGDSNDCLRLSIEAGSDSKARLRWNTKGGKVYSVWKCNDLRQGFNKVGDEVLGQANNGEAAFEDRNTAGAVFYKLEVKSAP